MTRSPIRYLTLLLSTAAIAIASAEICLSHDAGPQPSTGKHDDAGKVPAPNTLGFPTIKGGDFKLIDGHGRTRTSRDPDGRPQFLFFGYANCKAICSVALPRIAEAIQQLEEHGVIATPVMITVDAERDTVDAIQEPLEKIHPRFVGLTGSQTALEAAYRSFQVDRKVVFKHPEHGDVYAHGSYIYLLSGNGQFLTILPPVLSSERIAEVARDYLK